MTRFTLRRRDVLASGLAAAALAATGTRAVAAGMLPQHITDAQVHVWKAVSKPPSPNGRQEPLLAEELLAMLDGAGVERAVIITPSWSLGENAYSLESAQAHMNRLRVMGLYFDWNKPANPEQIDNWMKPQGMVGIRMFLGGPAVKWLEGSDSDWMWAALEKNNIPLMISASGSMPRLDAIAGKHPGLKMCVDNFGISGKPGSGVDAFKDNAAALAMAKHPNVVIKTCSIPYMSANEYPYKDLQPIVKQYYDAFGPDRLMFSSDITLLKTSYKDCVNFWTELDFLTDADRAKVMGGNISNWLNWPQPA